jgi:serine/threonine protein phosphatase PrpC
MATQALIPLEQWSIAQYFGVSTYPVGGALLGHVVSCDESTSIFKRLTQGVFGVCLLIPLVNSIVLAILRLLACSFKSLGLDEKIVRSSDVIRVSHVSTQKAFRYILVGNKTVRLSHPPKKHGGARDYRDVLVSSVSRPPFQKKQDFCSYARKEGVTPQTLDQLEYWIELDARVVTTRLDRALRAARAQQREEMPHSESHSRFHDAMQGLKESVPRQYHGVISHIPGVCFVESNDSDSDEEEEEKLCHVTFTEKDGVGIAFSKGVAEYMQDGCSVEPFSFCAGGKVIEGQLTSVFDGHGAHGEKCVQFMIANLAKCLQARLEAHNTEGVTKQGLFNGKVGFVDASRLYRDYGGVTANSCLEFDDTVVSYNIGDSRAIVVTSEGDVVQISEDARLQHYNSDPNKKYIDNVQKRGNGVGIDKEDMLRVEYILAPPRTLGDHRFDNSARPKVVIITREILENSLHRKLKPDEQLFLVQGSDGLFDVGASDYVGLHTLELLRLGMTESQVAARLVEGAILARSEDNIIALVKKLSI